MTTVLGPELRAEGLRLGYTTWAVLEAVEAHARTGSVGAAGPDVIEPADVAALDQAAESDAADAYAVACGPPEDWPLWTDAARWEPTEPAAGDVEWWAIQTRGTGAY